MTQPGPCIICGDTGYNLSCGGPTICPKCDCGHFDAATVEKQARVIADLRKQLAAVQRCDAETAGPTAEDIRACAWSTLIGWQHELGDSIDFICDQIARKATMPAVSSTHHGSPE